MIAKLIKGKGFRGALEYDLQTQKGQILETNMAGQTARELAKEFGAIRALRPNLTKAVCHVSLSISPDEKLSDEQWKSVAKSYLKHMGFEKCQYVATKHTDTEHPHIHLVVNRIGIDGQVVSDSQDYQRQESLMRKLEQELNLKTVEPSREAKRKSLTKGEVEHSVRTGEPSTRMLLQKIIDRTLQNGLNLETFTHKLEEQGVKTRLNQASTGFVSGISFSLNEVALKGSDLGKNYTWNALQKRGLTHEQVRHDQRIDGCTLGENISSGQSDNQSEEIRRNERGGTFGNESQPLEPTRDAKAEEQHRIDQAFERLARINKDSEQRNTPDRSRGQKLSR
ncbi:relaxase/mobilization nuclease domain-containing protein [Desulfovibrio litoralis]|uniref:Relaxase/Mobilisation nuclease domain-containing protein n=1 Tax=Desulfovibrio litoralis DSM 11393 TaxID=1121455 RepID=A0A1M7TLM0_9BACT|nr:relaxase/mobilization nuclease domain-containing protein [Desulfovibrio litoralis]SHN71605.1 Relaxase/Mobilisation nuclease domain-containing protein [Desulfovibrio litoralis DSM 11393]